VNALARIGLRTRRVCTLAAILPIAGTGGGDVSPDWEINGALSVWLRAERSPKGSGRIDTITVLCTDAAGNTSSRTASVTVPRKP
jgi:hypothetical protein